MVQRDWNVQLTSNNIKGTVVLDGNLTVYLLLYCLLLTSELGGCGGCASRPGRSVPAKGEFFST